MSLKNIKFTPPAVSSKSIERKPLLIELNKHANKKLVLIVAGAGWGKSTLLASYSELCGDSMLWYGMDQSDQDPGTFLSNLAEGVISIAPSTKEIILPAMKAFKRNSSDIISFVNSLLEAIFNAYPQQFILCLDDFHLAAVSSRLCRIIGYMLNNTPLSFHIILTARKTPNLPFTKLKSNGEVAELNAESLKFSRVEIKLFFNRYYGWDLSNEDLARIEYQTEGWPVGLRLLGESQVRKGFNQSSVPAIKAGADDDLVFSYFQGQIFSDLSLEDQTFLAKSSIFDSINVDLCKEVIGWKNASQFLERFSERGLFTTKIGSNEHAYRYHHLFQKFLYHWLETHVDPKIVESLHANSAAYFTKKGYWWEALTHSIRAHQYEAAVSVLEQAIGDFVSKGSAENLLRWIDYVPEEIIFKYSSTLYAKGWALFLLGNWREALSLLQNAKETAKKNGDAVFYGKAVQLLMLLHFFMHEFESSVKLAEECRPMLPAGAPEEALVDTQLAISLMQLNHTETVERVWQRVQNHPAVKSNIHLYMQTVPIMGFNFNYMLGQFEEATNLLDKAISHFKKWDYMGHLGRYLSYRAFVSNEMGDFTDAQEKYNESIRVMTIKGHKALLGAVCTQSLSNKIAMGYVNDAAEMLEMVKKIHYEAPEQAPWKDYSLYLSEALVAYEKGRHNEFYLAAEKTIFFIDKQNLWFDRYVAGCPLALRYTALGRGDTAIILLEKVLRGIGDLNAYYLKARVNLLMASIYYDQMNKDKALFHLQKALNISKERNYDFLFLKKEQTSAKKLLPLALEKEILIEFVSFLLVRLSSNSGEPILPLLESTDPLIRETAVQLLADLRCRDAESRLVLLLKDEQDSVRQKAISALERIRVLDPLPLLIKTFGKFELQQNGSIIPEKVWKRKTAKSILKFLILHANQDITFDLLLDTFYTENDPADGRKLLHQAISVIRKALEPGIAPKRKSAYLKAYENGYRFLLPDDSFVDVLVFERLIEEAMDAESNGDADTAFNKYTEALKLYQGDFLPDEAYRDWIITLHDRLSLLYVKACYQTAHEYFRRSDFDKSTHHLNMILQKEPWDENTHYLLMKNYFAQGDRPRLIKTYQKCKEILRVELNTTPSAKLTDLYKLSTLDTVNVL